MMCLNFRIVVMFAFVFGASIVASGQPEEWVVNPSAYQFTMSLTFTISIDDLTGSDVDVLAIFDDEGECRGVGEANYQNTGTGWYTGLMLVYSNVSSELDLNALIWDSSASSVIDSEDGLIFISDASLGNLNAPIIFSALTDLSIGCMDLNACNYLASATADSGGCLYPGCGDSSACNYTDNANCFELDLCLFPDPGLDCDGICLEDFDADGICDENELFGCSDPFACNYNIDVTEDDCSCAYANYPLDCEGNCFLDSDGNGVCDGFEIPGCIEPEACNFNDLANYDDQSCEYCCFNLPESEGYALDVEELSLGVSGLTRYRVYLAALQEGDRVLRIGGTGSPTLIQTSAAFFQHPLGGALASSITPENLLTDSTLNWDSWVTIGLDQLAAQEGAYDAEIEGSSVWSTLFEFGENIYLGGGNDDGWSLDATAINGMAGADLRVLLGQWTTDGDFSGQISILILPFGAPEPLNIILSYSAPQCGCANSLACNYDSSASWDDGTCTFADEGYNCEGNCVLDSDFDGVCDDLEIVGCSNQLALNFDSSVTEDDGSCLFLGCTYSGANKFDPLASIDDQSCVFDQLNLISCPDLNSDGLVGIGDLLIFLAAFGLIC